LDYGDHNLIRCYCDHIKNYCGVNTTNFRVLSFCLIIVNGYQLLRICNKYSFYLLQGMHGCGWPCLFVLWRVGVASNNGWWRELLHWWRFAEWIVGGKNKNDALPNSLIDSNVNLKWKHRKKLRHVLWLVAFRG
jgi:hypothetical protein